MMYDMKNILFSSKVNSHILAKTNFYTNKHNQIDINVMKAKQISSWYWILGVDVYSLYSTYFSYILMYILIIVLIHLLTVSTSFSTSTLRTVLKDR